MDATIGSILLAGVVIAAMYWLYKSTPPSNTPQGRPDTTPNDTQRK